MSIQIVVAVFDRAADVFGRPVFVTAKAAAIRSFSDQVNSNDKDNELCKHPDDFDLYHVSLFDDSKGVFSPAADDGQPVLLVRGKDLVK